MEFSKKQGQFLTDTVNQWEADEIITREVADKLKSSFAVRSFDWKRLAKYSFWIAIICGVIAFGAIFANDDIMYFIRRIFTSSNIGLCIILGIMAAAIYYLGLKRRKLHPEKIFSNEAIIFAGVLFTAASILYLGRAVDTGNGHFSILILFSTVVYAVLGLWFPSKLVWIFSILSLGAWFGTETGYESDWGAYFLGMNYPLRFVLFGAVLVGVSFFFKNNSIFLKSKFKLSDFYKSTYILGLLYLFIALWLLSIFGNYGDMDSWYEAKQIELLHWSLLFGLVAIGAIYYGLKEDDYTSRSFGITFLLINLYTRYFELFWNEVDKTIFFLLLAVSFWLIGSRAEKIWNLEFLKKRRQPNITDSEQ